MITATSVAVPMGPQDSYPMMEKSSSIEVSMDRNNFEYSSNMNSKVSGPLRESELLDFNRRNGMNANSGHYPEFDDVQRDALMQSQERRLPLSKISSENSGIHPERVTNGIGNSTYFNGLNEVPEEVSVDLIQQMEYENQYQEYDEEPEPKMSAPTPHTMVTNYKEVRDQKKWQKVNSGLAMF